jgi:hypothetical protein
MFTLTKEEVDLLMNSTDPKIAAAAKKLKEAEEKGEFVPKSRIDHLTTELKKLKDDQQVIADAKKVAEDAAAKATLEEAARKGEWQKIIDAEKAKTEAEKVAREKVEKELNDLKPLADQAKKYRDIVIAKVKEKMGDKFLSEYETFSLESLGKLVPEAIIGTEKTLGGPVPKTDVKSMDEKSFRELENKVMSGQRVTLQ